MTSLVSICIPCHNAACYIGPALESVLAQSWPNVEIIVVNDGSSDGSAEALEGFVSRGVRVIHERCGSAAKARNLAYREATGSYIKFFDADDLLSSDMVKKQMLRLNGRDDAVASSEWGRFYSDDTSSYSANFQSVWRDMKALDWLIEAWRDARPMMQPGMFLIPRAIMAKAGAWDEKLTLIDDFEFFARILCHATEVLFTPGATLYYRSGLKGSLSGRKTREAVESAYDSLVKGTGHLLGLRNDPLARQSCANVLRDFVYTYYPDHSDLRAAMERRIDEMGGSNLLPEGPPGFQLLRKGVGWKVARRVQKLLRR